MAHTTTWEPHENFDENHIPDDMYALPKQKRVPLADAVHVRNAMERLQTIEEISDDDRQLAFMNIKKAAEHFHVEICGEDWDEFCRRPQPEIFPRD